MALQAVIFDLDNTLVNRKLAFKAYLDSFIDTFVVVSDHAERIRIAEYIQKADQNGYRSKQELYGELLNTLTMKSESTTIDELLEFWFSEFYRYTVLMEGAQEVLSWLRERGILIGLITNGSKHAQNSKIDCVRIRSFFDTIIVSDEVQLKKPDKRIFEIAVERLGICPQNAVYVGDHPVNDIRGAIDAGLRAVWLKGFMDWDAALGSSDCSINHLYELIELFEGFSTESQNII